jgi:hypothetical protein
VLVISQKSNCSFGEVISKKKKKELRKFKQVVFRLVFDPQAKAKPIY